MKLTPKQSKTLRAIHDLNYCTVYQLAEHLFGEGERYGLPASRAQGRFQTVKRMGLADNSSGYMRITPAGRAALEQEGSLTNER